MLTQAKFDHAFQLALFAVGAFLVLFGAASSFLSAKDPSEHQSIEEALSFGFNSLFFSIFSGVLIGVGAALFIDGLILGIPGSKAHMLLAFCFCALSIFLSASAISNLSTLTFQMMVLFFAGMASAGAFLLSTVVFGMSGLLRLYLSRKK
ncbi:MAG: hypothetical protein N3F07_02705 [Candidatus Micrarchaeota archaeon]|nr:hypothetical protein [Candidatus Micrarchaeota archaeon]